MARTGGAATTSTAMAGSPAASLAIGSARHAANAGPPGDADACNLTGDAARLMRLDARVLAAVPQAARRQRRHRSRAAAVSRQFGDLFELQGGEQKTHTVWLDFAAARNCRRRLAWTHEPARVHATPEWYAASQAVPHFCPPPPTPTSARRVTSTKCSPARTACSPSARSSTSTAGGTSATSTPTTRQAYYAGPSRSSRTTTTSTTCSTGRCCNTSGPATRGGSSSSDPLARHVIDIDIYHTTARQGGVQRRAVLAHRPLPRRRPPARTAPISRHNCQPRRQPYGGGPGSEHNYTTGLLHYYYLTGDPDARDAVLGLADWVLAHGRRPRNVLGLVDDGPTGLASIARRFDYHGPGRGGGNSINVPARRLAADRRCDVSATRPRS